MRTIALYLGMLVMLTSGTALAQRLTKGTLPFYAPLSGPADVIMSKLVLQPGDSTGWHYHPGYVFVVINSGTVTEDTGCGDVSVFTPGMAFEEVQPARIHRVRNLGSVTAELYITNIVPTGMAGSTVVAAPLCGPPETISDCIKGGWMNFGWPRSFTNQGDCIAFVTMTTRPACDQESLVDHHD